MPSVPTSLESKSSVLVLGILFLGSRHPQSASHASFPHLTLTGGTPTPSPTSRLQHLVEPRRLEHAAQLRTRPLGGPNKSLAFNYSSGLILMQLPVGGG